MVLESQSTSLEDRRGRAICNISPHKLFVMKNIPVEEANSGNLETCFDVSRRSREMQDELTIPVMSYIVTVWPGWLVTQASHARFACVLMPIHT